MQSRYLKKYWLICRITIFAFLAQVSSINGASDPPSSTTYALIIGVADYKDAKIRDLNYSDDDAYAFYNYLKSEAGGSVDTSNIKLLINESATVSRIYAAKKWIESKVNKRDKVYIYFAGHGDRESSRFKLGFLLAQDSPHKNYLNNAVRIEDLNLMASTLSLNKQVEAIIITDACHSGTVSGIDNIHKKALVQQELIKTQQQEVRIASCEPNQLSQENEVWGGGRGVFSYFLIKGLKGLADADKDKQVTVKELSVYLRDNVEDEIFNYMMDDQTPVIEGLDNKPLSIVTDNAVEEADGQATPSNVTSSSRSLSEVNTTLPQRYLRSFSDGKLGSLFDFNDLSQNNAERIIDSIFGKFSIVIKPNIYRPWTNDTTDFSRYVQMIDTDVNAKEDLKQEIAIVIHDEIQELINLYLDGDEGELEARRYYQREFDGYEKYIKMIDVAMGLIDKEDDMYKLLEVKKYYFTGVLARLNISYSDNVAELLDKALKAQKAALKLEPNAAYIHNELGVIYANLKDYSTSIAYFKDAIELSQDWALPHSNLAQLYTNTNEVDKAISAGVKADSLQPNAHAVYTNLGIAYLADENYLLSEEYFRKAIQLNDRHFRAFDGLGEVYHKLTNYHLADTFYYEGYLRKQGTIYDPACVNPAVYSSIHPTENNYNCKAPEKIDEADYACWFTSGYIKYSAGKYEESILDFQKAVDADQDNPIALYYMGRAHYHLGNNVAAELMFKFARTYIISGDELKMHLDEVQAQEFGYDRSCCIDTYTNILSSLNPKSINFYLGHIYKKMHHFEEAEDEYRDLIFREDYNLEAIYLLQSMLESLGRWKETEHFLKEIYKLDEEFAIEQLNGFYFRASKANPTDATYPYNHGNLLYEIAKTHRNRDVIDTIIYFPGLRKEHFINQETYSSYESMLPYIVDGDEEDVDTFYPRHYEEVLARPNTINQHYTDEVIIFAPWIQTPRYDGIQAFLTALPLYFDSITQASINFKIGNLYTWAGSVKQSFPYLEEAVNLGPTDAGYRRDAIINGTKLYENRKVYSYLTRSYQDTMINHLHTRQFAEFSIMAKDYNQGMAAAKVVDGYYPYEDYFFETINAKLLFYAHRNDQAIKQYQFLLDKGVDKNSNLLYTLALIHAKNNDTSNAKKYLGKAIDAGFNYTWVLDYEPAWKRIFGRKGWRKKYEIKATPPVYRTFYLQI